MVDFPCNGPRVIVAGISGSGKTTLATAIAARCELPYAEIDALFHGPGWVPRPEFLDDVERFAAQERWVTEWQYDQVRDLLASRATMLVWLDVPRRVALRQVIRRTVARRLGRIELWNGNREQPLRELLTDRDHIIRWTWNQFHPNRARVEQAIVEHPHLDIVVLRTRREQRAWLASLPDASGDPA